MTLRQALYNKLVAQSSITSLLHSATSVYHVKMPDNVQYPAISFQIMPGGWRVHTMGSDSGPVGTEVLISCWGKTAESVENVAAAVRTEIKDFSGTMGGAGGVAVERIFIESSIEVEYQDTAKVFVAHLSVLVDWTE